MSDTQCPVCSNKLATAPTTHQKYEASIYDCRQCGQYVLSELAKVDREFHDSKKLISAWIRLQNKRGNSPPFIGDHFFEDDWFKNLHSMGFPQTVNEKLNELLKAYADIVKDDYNLITAVEHHPEVVSTIAAKNLDEVMGLNRLLAELGYIEPTATHVTDRVRLTAMGWHHIDDLLKSTSSGDLAFIAMWYDPSMDEYRESVKSATIECGYEPIIIDDVDFNDFIMDEVIQFIRQARFLIADLTCSPEIDISINPKVIQGTRGGVYWEAGMAFGLGKTVIQTCRNDDCSKRRIHFDRDQYQTIFWKQEELIPDIRPSFGHIHDPTFAEKLAQRILATVGKGNYITPG